MVYITHLWRLGGWFIVAIPHYRSCTSIKQDAAEDEELYVCTPYSLLVFDSLPSLWCIAVRLCRLMLCVADRKDRYCMDRYGLEL